MKLHMKKCSASTVTQGEDENTGGREENSAGESNLGTWGEVEHGLQNIEEDLFSAIFEPEVEYDLPTHIVNQSDIQEGAETWAGDDGDEIDGDEDDEDANGGVGNEDDGNDKEGENETHIGYEAGGEGEEENIDLENVNNHIVIKVKAKEAVKALTLNNKYVVNVKEEERVVATKELSLHEASLLSLLASGLATSANILSSLTPQLQVLTPKHLL